jgi:F-type H+-transporting ATPase subunit c
VNRNGLFLALLAPAGAAFASEIATNPQFFTASALAVMIGVGIAASVSAIAMGSCIVAALNGIARQPETTAKLQLNMMIGLAFIESLVLYTLFLGIVLLFANPFAKYFIG